MRESVKAKVTEQGLIIPREFLEGIEEVEIHKEDNLIVVIPTSQTDPILELGKHPVACGTPDASEYHDKYLYGSVP
jgi:virulence-associated protein VagC